LSSISYFVFACCRDRQTGAGRISLHFRLHGRASSHVLTRVGREQAFQTDHFQPQNRQPFAFAKAHRARCFSMTARQARSLRNSLKLLVPCKLRTRRRLRVCKAVLRVRIHFPPPHSLQCREFCESSPKNLAKSPPIRGFLCSNRTAEKALAKRKWRWAPLFSDRHSGSPVSRPPVGE